MNEPVAVTFSSAADHSLCLSHYRGTFKLSSALPGSASKKPFFARKPTKIPFDVLEGNNHREERMGAQLEKGPVKR